MQFGEFLYFYPPLCPPSLPFSVQNGKRGERQTKKKWEGREMTTENKSHFFTGKFGKKQKFSGGKKAHFLWGKTFGRKNSDQLYPLAALDFPTVLNLTRPFSVTKKGLYTLQHIQTRICGKAPSLPPPMYVAELHRNRWQC